MINLKEKTKELFDLREQQAVLDAEYEAKTSPIRERKDALQTEILKELSDAGQFSARFEFATVTRAVRKTPKVVDEEKVISWLKKKKLSKEYVKQRLSESFYASLGETVKQGIEVDGVQVFETEYVSLKKPTSDEHRKVTTE